LTRTFIYGSTLYYVYPILVLVMNIEETIEELYQNGMANVLICLQRSPQYYGVKITKTEQEKDTRQVDPEALSTKACFLLLFLGLGLANAF